MANSSDILSKLPMGWQIFVAILLSLAAIGLPLPKILGWLGRHTMLPPRDKWIAICKPAEKTESYYGDEHLDANRPLHYKGRWCQMRAQKINDYYEIDMLHNRWISRVRLEVDDIRYPAKYSIEIAKNGAQFKLEGEYSGLIDRPFAKPIKFRKIRFTIVETQIRKEDNWMPSWCVDDVVFTEKILWFKRDIK